MILHVFKLAPLKQSLLCLVLCKCYAEMLNVNSEHDKPHMLTNMFGFCQITFSAEKMNCTFFTTSGLPNPRSGRPQTAVVPEKYYSSTAHALQAMHVQGTTVAKKCLINSISS